MKTASPHQKNESHELLRDTTLKLFSYCQTRDWAGSDPYDALNSTIIQSIPLLDRRIPRLIFSQVLKRSVINLRPLLRVPPAQNPKSLGLFLMSALKLSALGLVRDGVIQSLIASIKKLRAPDNKYYCWGYSFPWQTRTLLVPRWSPNLVCTVFVGNALLDAFERSSDGELLEIASSAAKYILEELYWTDGSEIAGFAYPLPSMRNGVHNGNLLGAAFLTRVAKHTGNKSFIDPALKVARYSASRQRPDGSWMYGETPAQQWIDNFHTGYNLDALREIAIYLATSEFDKQQIDGFRFYREHFFREDGAPRYFHNQTYPIDIHAVSQSIITPLRFRDIDPENIVLAQRTFQWAMDNMWDERGFFYYRILRSCKIRTSYMRWSQSWMLIALTTLLDTLERSADHISCGNSNRPATVQESNA